MAIFSSKGYNNNKNKNIDSFYLTQLTTFNQFIIQIIRRSMTWEGERGGFYFRLSLFDIEKLMEKVRCEVRAKGVGQVWIFFKSLIDHLSRQRRL